jgi:hypothetical protein
MEPNDQSVDPTRVANVAPGEPRSAVSQPITTRGRSRLSGGRRAVASMLLSVGLLAIGGVAIVNAASPAPAASTAPGASSQPGGGNGAGGNANCPNM